MKVIHSHYIPLPEPHNLIATPDCKVYKQIGSMAVVMESEEAKYGYETRVHPVVIIAMRDEEFVDTDGHKKVAYSIAPAEGDVLYDYVLDDCFLLCPADKRELNYLKFNMLAMKFMTFVDNEAFDLSDVIEAMEITSVKLDFPKDNNQEVVLTMESSDDLKDIYITSSLNGLYFLVLFGELKDHQIECDLDVLQMEFVNQARAYLKINPNYQFHFSSPLKELKEIVDKLNNELNDYLVRDDE